MRPKLIELFALTLGLILLVAQLTACASETGIAVETPGPIPVDTAPAPPLVAEDDDKQGNGQSTDVSDVGVISGAEEMAGAVASRTPVPTPTPGIVGQGVNRIAEEVGLSGKSFLGLTTEDWIDIAISLVILLFGYLLAILIVRLVLALVKRITQGTSTQFDDGFLAAIGSEIKWLVMVIVLRFALLRLGFWSDGQRTLINDVCFSLATILLVVLVMKLIRFLGQWYRDNLDPEKDRDRLEPMIMLLQRSTYMLVIIVGVSVGMSHFGFDVAILSVVLILIVLVVSLGARDIIADAITGFIILMDQPFRVGDVIEIEDLNKWGEVIDIGTRTTRILTRDNRYVIVPNSTIGDSQVINYTFPDRTFRIFTEILVAYGSDFDQMRLVAINATRAVEGVLVDAPVDVLFYEYGLLGRKIRVRWWIDDMHMEKRIIDRVNESLEIAFAEAGIQMPVTTHSLVIQMESVTGD